MHKTYGQLFLLLFQIVRKHALHRGYAPRYAPHIYMWFREGVCVEVCADNFRRFGWVSYWLYNLISVIMVLIDTALIVICLTVFLIGCMLASVSFILVLINGCILVLICCILVLIGYT